MGRLWVDLSPTAIVWWKRVVNLTGLHIPVLGVRNRAVMLPGIQHIKIVTKDRRLRTGVWLL